MEDTANRVVRWRWGTIGGADGLAVDEWGRWPHDSRRLKSQEDAALRKRDVRKRETRSLGSVRVDQRELGTQLIAVVPR